MTTLTLYTPSGVLANAVALKRAVRRLAALGFVVSEDAGARLKYQRFAGEDNTRLAALHRGAATG
jgi:muramoyltetrapeptide carboxypeptidase